MGSKKKAPSPPKITYPKMTAEERALLNKQITLTDQLIGQSGKMFDQSQLDRELSMQYLGRLDGPYKLSSDQETLANQLSQSLYDQSYNTYTRGAQQEVFDRSRRDSIASLVGSGLTNSSTAVDIISQLEKERLRGLQDISDKAGISNLQLKNQMIQQKMAQDQGVFETLYGGQRQGGALAGQLAQQGLAGAGQAQQTLGNERMNAFNVQVQNMQAQYMKQLQDYNQPKSGFFGKLGGVLGAGLGAALALPTGGMSLLGGAALGGALGGGVGSLF